MNTNIQSELNLCEKLLNLDLKIFSSYPKEKESNRLVKLQDDLNELKTDLDDQIRRYKKKNFEIAVVGREKAGKSSLLNAWIGFELLPSDRNRCTYTTVEIRSCAHIDDQKYLIDYLTTDQFDLNYKNIVNSHASKELQEKEYAEINSKLEQIKTYLNKPSKLKSFRNFDDVKAELRSAISDVGHARAVKNICIWTPKISSTEESNVVLYDVPGYDSPITLHKEQTKLKIAKVDAVLYAKKFIEPDLVDCEIEILKITDLNDPFLKAKDKIVVALTNCDQAVSSKDFKSLTYSNYRAWKSYDIYESRVIPVCSLAELKGNTPEGFKSKQDLDNLNMGDTGFVKLKEAVNQLVNDSRLKIARERCNHIKNQIKDFNSKLNDLIKFDFNIDTNSKLQETIEENEMNRIYNEWWAQIWQRLKEEFQIFYSNEIRQDQVTSGYLDERTSFKTLYDKLVDKTIRSIPSTKKYRQEEIYPLSIGDDGVDNPKKANTLIRDELALDAINSLDKITVELTGFLCSKVDKLVDWVRNKLWNLPEIRQLMIGKNEDMEILLLKRSFDALIQRLARPATNIFLKYPRSRIERSKVLQEYQMEIIIINSFVTDFRIVQRGIVQFLANGELGNLATDLENKILFTSSESKDQEQDQETITGDSISSYKTNNKHHRFGFLKNKSKPKQFSVENVSNISQMIETVGSVQQSPGELSFSKDADSLVRIQIEIEQDVEEFINCMKNSIYYGSGIQRFLYQELDKIRRKFLFIEESKRGWWTVIDNHLKNKNNLTNKIPAPEMADEIAKRSQMIKSVKEIQSIISEF